MGKEKIRPLDILYWIALVFADLFIYIVLGMLMMGYDDFYNESKGPYWSWQSMSPLERVIYVLLQLWNVFNAFVVLFLIWKGFRYYKRRTTNTVS